MFSVSIKQLIIKTVYFYVLFEITILMCFLCVIFNFTSKTARRYYY